MKKTVKNPAYDTAQFETALVVAPGVKLPPYRPRYNLVDGNKVFVPPFIEVESPSN